MGRYSNYLQEIQFLGPNQLLQELKKDLTKIEATVYGLKTDAECSESKEVESKSIKPSLY
jgi:hypothetical protein